MSWIPPQGFTGGGFGLLRQQNQQRLGMGRQETLEFTMEMWTGMTSEEKRVWKDEASVLLKEAKKTADFKEKQVRKKDNKATMKCRAGLEKDKTIQANKNTQIGVNGGLVADDDSDQSMKISDSTDQSERISHWAHQSERIAQWVDQSAKMAYTADQSGPVSEPLPIDLHTATPPPLLFPPSMFERPRELKHSSSESIGIPKAPKANHAKQRIDNARNIFLAKKQTTEPDDHLEHIQIKTGVQELRLNFDFSHSFAMSSSPPLWLYCFVCKSGPWASVKGLEAHIGCVHLGWFPYRCTAYKCNFHSTTDTQMLEHFKSIHPMVYEYSSSDKRKELLNRCLHSSVLAAKNATVLLVNINSTPCLIPVILTNRDGSILPKPDHKQIKNVTSIGTGNTHGATVRTVNIDDESEPSNSSSVSTAPPPVVYRPTPVKAIRPSPDMPVLQPMMSMVKCWLCGEQRAMDELAMRCHIWGHTGKPWSCEVCGCGFNYWETREAECHVIKCNAHIQDGTEAMREAFGYYKRACFPSLICKQQ